MKRSGFPSIRATCARRNSGGSAIASNSQMATERSTIRLAWNFMHRFRATEMPWNRRRDVRRPNINGHRDLTLHCTASVAFSRSRRVFRFSVPGAPTSSPRDEIAPKHWRSTPLYYNGTRGLKRDTRFGRVCADIEGMAQNSWPTRRRGADGAGTLRRRRILVAARHCYYGRSIVSSPPFVIRGFPRQLSPTHETRAAVRLHL